MKPMEIKLIREFKEKKTIVENFFMGDLVDIITDYADKRGQEKYKLVKDMCDNLKEIMNKMNDLQGFADNLTEYNKTICSLNTLVTSIDEYFDTEKDFSEEILKVTKDNMQKDLDELQQIVFMAQYTNNQKSAYNMQFQMKKMLDDITYSINQTLTSVIPIYRRGMNEVIKEIIDLTDKKIDLYTNLKNKNLIKNSDELQKQDCKKIFDYKKMNKLFRDNGWYEDRQTGDHKIFKNEDGKSVPVPQHSLGLGLSSKIQKSI